MRKNKIIYLFYIIFTFVLCTCYDPVFYAISLEVEPIHPRIEGVGTNFVIYQGRMLVASGNTLYSYNYGGDEEWAKPYWLIEAYPGGNILQIASTGANLYALCATDQNNDGMTVIKRMNEDNLSWTQLGGILNNYGKIHNIFAAGGVLFASATASTTSAGILYTVLYVINDTADVLQIKLEEPEEPIEPEEPNAPENPEDPNDPEAQIDIEAQNDTGEINGAAFNGNSYFLSIKDRGVYKIDDFNEGAKRIHKDAYGNEVGVILTGIINLQDDGNTILVVARNGAVYIVNDSIDAVVNISMGKIATGAIGLWRENDQPESNRLLLVGRQDSLSYSASYGYSYGYMELELDAGGIKEGSNFNEPGRISNSTLYSYERYQSTIGKNPLNYIFQVPSSIDSNMTLFAATQRNGVWSCRDRAGDGNKYWNAEGENEP